MEPTDISKYDTHVLIDSLTQLEIQLSDKQVQQFLQYYELLVDWNERMNLTAITEFNDVITKHFVDSLTIIKALDMNQKLSLIDIGTGAGFPGIPIKICFPNVQVTLLDSLEKRIRFLDCVIDTLQLTDIQTYHGRAEDYAKPELLREKYDVAVSRAVANLNSLSEYCLPYVKVGGVFISYKAESAEDEMKAAKGAFYLLGGREKEMVSFTLPNSEIGRSLCVIEKIQKTSNKYPRKAGLPTKEPLK